MSATALKSTKISSLNHQKFEFFGLFPKSPNHTGLIGVKTLEPNISSLGHFKITTVKLGQDFWLLSRRIPLFLLMNNARLYHGKCSGIHM
jgi:hypothetical protein